MIKYFKSSIWVTIIGAILAFLWAQNHNAGSGFMALFIVFFLSILEVTLSFDNAVVNAMKLEKMTPLWQHRFITWGILIAVFGMRFVFPILVVAIFSGLGMIEVTKMALTDVDKYTHYLHISHPPLVAFGGTFLMMLFLSYFLNKEKELDWIKCIETPIKKLTAIKYIDVVICLMALVWTEKYVPAESKVHVLTAGIAGVVLYLLIDGISKWLENIAESNASLTTEAAKGGFFSFLYLELIDASFSLDGVLGAFAICKDIVIITIGLAIGAMFVRSLTIYFVEMKTLKQFIYLEHGAHWAIGFLAMIMLYSTHNEVPEVVTGLIGLLIVGAAFINSLKAKTQE